MDGGPDGGASDLEAIELTDEFGDAEDAGVGDSSGFGDFGDFGDFGESARSRDRGGSRRWMTVVVVAVGVVAISALAFALGRFSHHGASSASDASAPTSLAPVPTVALAPPPVRSDEPLLGAFYPAVRRSEPTTIVMPNGLTFTLARGAYSAIGGLGGAFFGTVTPKGASCCALSFELLHAAPSDLFTTLAPGAAGSPALVSSADAVQPDRRQVHGQVGLLSTGDWTLIASFEDGDHTAEADAFVLQALGTWHLRSTPNGAVIGVPAGSTVNNSEVDFGRVPDLTERQVNFVRSNPCQIGPRPMFFGTAVDTTGRWCRDGLAVTIEGPGSYVLHATAALEITRPR